MNTVNNIIKHNGRLFAATVVTLIAILFPFSQVLADNDSWKGGIDRDQHDSHKLEATIYWGHSNYNYNWTLNKNTTQHTISGYINQLKISSWYMSLYKTYDQWINGNKTCSSYELTEQRLEWNVYNSQTSSWDFYWSYIYGTVNYPSCDNCCLVYPDTYWTTGTGNMIQYLIDNGNGGSFAFNVQLSVKKQDGGNRDYFPGNDAKLIWNFTVPGFYASNLSFSNVRHNAGVQSKTFNFKAWAFGSTSVTLSFPNDSPFGFNSDCSLKSKTISSPSDGTQQSVTIYFDPSTAGEYSKKLTIQGTYSGSTYTKRVDVTGTSITNPVVEEGAKPVVSGSTVKLSGFLKAHDCVPDLYETGFEYWKTSTPGTKYTVKTTHAAPKTTNATWEETIYGLEAGSYTYQPYVKKTTTTTATYKSASTYTFTVEECDYAVGDTIYYTIDGAANKDICNLVFNTIAEAKTHLLSQTAWVSSSASTPNKLLKHVVFQVAPGIYQTASGLAGAIDITEINKWDADHIYTPDKQFIIRALNPSDQNNKPTLYGVDMRYSRNITLYNLNIQRTTSTKGYEQSAVIAGNTVVNSRVAGFMSNANITIKNCYITGTAFCVLHITDCDGLYMENNNLKASLPSYSDDANKCDAVHWGSSIKMMNVKNAKIMRNNFRGSHTTSLLIQGSQNLLIMNNVFWNDNIIFDNTRKHISFIRLLAMAQTTSGGNNNKLTDIGIYYNTFYLKKNPSESTPGYTTYKCDFFRLGGACGSNGSCSVKTCSDSQQDNPDYYILKESTTAKIEFMYNNCYSLSNVVTGTGAFGAAPFLSKDASDLIGIKKNNFWSAYDSPSATSSVFAVGTENDFINVSQLLCKTMPDDPDGLVIKGSDLNKGVLVATTTGTALGAGKIRTDRNGLQNARPTSGTGWTYGAYQQSVSTGEIEVIYWNGKEGANWDTRGSWYKKINGENKVLTCVDVLSNNLKAVIPDNLSTYPEIPEWDDYPDLVNGEEVRTGIVGSDATGYEGSKFFKSIELEYGAAIVGVENLKPSSTRYYNSATSKFEVMPKSWTLVGSVIAHESKETPGTQEDITSYDFYKQHQPEVYMQHVKVDDNKLVWGVPFTDLDESVSPTSCYAIYIADEYTDGKYYKYPARSFFRMPEHYDVEKADNAAKESVKYSNSGFFINESALPSITIKGTDDDCEGWNFFNNSYPACLKVSSLCTALGPGFNVQYHDNDGWHGGAATSMTSSSDFINPQNGFVIQKTTSGSVTKNMESTWFDSSESTKYRNALSRSIFTLRVVNTLENKGARVTILSEGENADVLIGANAEYPVLYIPSDSKKFSSYSMNAESAIVPVTVLNQGKNAFHLQFMTYELNGFESVVLEDRLTGLNYNLSGGEQPTIYGIPAGVTEGRFFLNLNNYSEGGDDEEPDVPTIVEDVKDEGLIIFNRGNELTVSSQYKETIESIYVSDMAGRSFNVTPTSAYYSVNVLPIASGVYTVTVVTEKRTVQQKILIK